MLEPKDSIEKLITIATILGLKARVGYSISRDTPIKPTVVYLEDNTDWNPYKYLEQAFRVSVEFGIKTAPRSDLEGTHTACVVYKGTEYSVSYSGYKKEDSEYYMAKAIVEVAYMVSKEKVQERIDEYANLRTVELV